MGCVGCGELDGRGWREGLTLLILERPAAGVGWGLVWIWIWIWGAECGGLHTLARSDGISAAEASGGMEVVWGSLDGVDVCSVGQHAKGCELMRHHCCNANCTNRIPKAIEKLFRSRSRM